MKHFNHTWLPFLVPLLMVPTVQARDYGATISLSSQSTDNALKTQDQSISERQDHLQLGVFALQKNEYWDLDVNYNAAYNTFSEDSQESRSILEGDGKLTLGQSTQPAGLILSHSRRNLLNAPQQINLLQNTDERDISTINPLLRARLSPVDFLIFSADYTEITFKRADTRDSTRTSGKLQWQHALSAIDSLQLFAQQTDIDFSNNDSAGYVTQMAGISYSAQLRRLSYDISAGYNSSDSDLNGRYSHSNYALNAQYNSGAQVFGLHVLSEITDTSMGNGNQGEVIEPLALDAIGIGFDQIKRQYGQLNWGLHFLAERWQLNASVQREERDYVVLPEDYTESAGRITLDYTLSRTSSIMLGVERQKTTAMPGAIQGSFDADIINASYRHSFASDIDCTLFGRNEKRTAQPLPAPALAIGSYDENIVGLAINYQY